MSSGLLCMAAASGHVQKVLILTDASAKINGVTDKRGYSPLMAAAENPSTVATAKILLACGADVRFKADDSGLTALHVACKTGHVRMVSLLLKHGADPMATDIAGRTPLHWACVNSSTSIPKLLLKKTKGSLLNVQDHSGYSALMVASEYNRADLVKFLLGQGANAHSFTNRLTHTASEVADWYGYSGVVSLLKAHTEKSSA